MAGLRRRLLSSMNFGATVLLAAALFIMVNWLSGRRYTRWDLTRQQFSVLSEQTRQALRSLEEPVTVIVFYQPVQRLYELVKDLLKEYERHTDQLTIEFVDPEQDRARALQLAQQFGVDDTSLVIVQSGSRHKYLTEPELVEYDYQQASMAGPQIKAFKGEEALTAALLNVVQAAQPLAWVTTGHGEKLLDVTEPLGLGDAKRQLEQQNLRLETVTLLERGSIPADVGLVIVPGPSRRFTEPEVQLLEAYLRGGGRVLLLLDPLTDTGLEPLAASWGITLGGDIVVDPARQLPFVSAANLFVTAYTQHPIVEKMKTLATLYPLARSVRPVEPAPEGIKVTPLALTSDAGWGETQTSVQTFKFDDGADLKGPVPIAAAAQRDDPTPARLVVIGDSEFIVNAQLGNAGNQDLLLGAVNWLIDRQQLIGIGPKTFQSLRLSLTGRQPLLIFFASLFALPLAFGLLGVGVWWARRA